MFVFSQDELFIKIKDNGSQNSDLPTISLEIGLGKEKHTIVNFFYREFTGGVSGLSDMNSQTERLQRQINIWKQLCLINKNFICLGYANICATKWNDESYHLSNLCNMVQNFMLETSCMQLVKGFTRSEVGQGGVVSRSCIDHCYTNNPDKVAAPELIAVGNSDHLGVVARKNVKSMSINLIPS